MENRGVCYKRLPWISEEYLWRYLVYLYRPGLNNYGPFLERNTEVEE